jgi:RNA polymerase sigma-70 factor (ECF subfamily)
LDVDMDVTAPHSVVDAGLTREELQLLVQRASTGDGEAFGKLYDLNLDAVYRYVYYKIGDGVEAEDLTSQIFVKAWEAMPRYQCREIPFSHWLMRLARNAVIDHYRTRKPQGELNEAMVSPEPDPQGEYLRGEQVRGLESALRQLPEEQRSLLVLRFVEEMNYAEMAKIVGKSPGALRVMQHRALAALRRILDREGR